MAQGLYTPDISIFLGACSHPGYASEAKAGDLQAMICNKISSSSSSQLYGLFPRPIAHFARAQRAIIELGPTTGEVVKSEEEGTCGRRFDAGLSGTRCR